VQHAVAAVIAALAKYELGARPWPELLQLTQQCCESAHVAQRDLGMFLLSAVAATSTAWLEPHYDYFIPLMARMLQDPESATVRIAAFQYGPHPPFYLSRAALRCAVPAASDEDGRDGGTGTERSRSCWRWPVRQRAWCVVALVVPGCGPPCVCVCVCVCVYMLKHRRGLLWMDGRSGSDRWCRI
jgi:hypothetical protein